MTSEKEPSEPDESAEGETRPAVPARESDGEPTEHNSDRRDAHDAPAEPRDTIVRRMLRGARARIGTTLLAAAFVVSAGLAPWLYLHQYHPDQQTNAAAAKVALQAACSGSVALLSYSPDNLVEDFAAARTHLTGDFLSYYTEFSEQIVAPAAKQKSVKTTASVARSAVAEIHPDSAVVLVFINQITTSKENPTGRVMPSAVRVGMKKIDSTWLISSFDPM
jgi:Mce-associated membrane protein